MDLCGLIVYIFCDSFCKIIQDKLRGKAAAFLLKSAKNVLPSKIHGFVNYVIQSHYGINGFFIPIKRTNVKGSGSEPKNGQYYALSWIEGSSILF